MTQQKYIGRDLEVQTFYAVRVSLAGLVLTLPDHLQIHQRN